MTQLSLFSAPNDEIIPPVRGLMEEKAIKRLYYSIAEVSRITGLKQYVLRYWETEFADLRPAKNRAGNRIYRKSDIKLVFLIKRLLYQEKYTIEGARRKLSQMKKVKDQQMQFSLADYKYNDVVDEIRKGLQELLDILDNKKIKKATKSD